MWLLLLSLVSASAPDFRLTVSAEQGPAELLRRARIRCGGVSEPATTDGGLTGIFSCPESFGVDVTHELRAAELVVLGKVTQVETPPAKLFGDPEPGWKRAAIKVERVLKGAATKSTSFLFIGSTKDENAYAPKVKVGQRGVWVLTRGTGATRELMMLSALDSQPPASANYLSELLTEAQCPDAPSGTCPQEGAVCPGSGTTCTCESPCQGGLYVGGSYRPPRWLCRPTACATAVAGEKCTDGLACEGCWGAHPFTCENGRWVFHDIPPPP